MKDGRVEQFLTQKKYSFAYSEALPLGTLQLQASLRNPGRIRQLDDDRVQDLALAMEDGAVMPAIVVFKIGEQYLIATGCHRVAAAQLCGRKALAAYVVKEDDGARRDHLIRTLNTIEGMGETRDEKLHHAIAEHEKYKKTAASLAREYKLPQAVVEVALRAYRSGQRAQAMGISLRGLPRNTQAALAAIDADVVYEAAARLTTDAALGQEQVRELVKEVRANRSTEQAQMNVVKRWRDRPDIRRMVRDKQDGSSRRQSGFFMMAGRLLTYCKSRDTLEAMGLTSPERREAAHVVAVDVRNALAKLVDRLETAMNEESAA